MTMRKKLLITIACLSVILCTLVTGTIAWLTDKTDPIENQFTPSDISVTLTETNFEKKMVPGKALTKTATVTVTNDISCYVFIKVEASTVLSKYIAYSVDNSVWTALTSQAGVYYKEITTTGTSNFTVLGAGSVTVNSTAFSWAANEVLVLPSVTKAEMQALKESDAIQPTLTFTAYACQKEGFGTPEDAWAEAKNAVVSPSN